MLDFKAEVVRHKQAENLKYADCVEKLDFLLRLAKHWEKQYEAGHLTAAAGRSKVHPEQAAITRLRAELSPAKLEVASLMALRQPEKAAAYFAEDML